jgi:cytochrome c oxidase subunit 4
MNQSNTEHSHVIPLRVYLGVGVALLVLTAVTVVVAQIQLGGFNVVVALFIAAIKASLVVLYFMHLRYDKKIFLIIFLIAILFLSAFIVLTMFDTMTRGEFYEIEDGNIREAIIYDIQTVPDSTATTGEPDSAVTVPDSTS